MLTELVITVAQRYGTTIALALVDQFPEMTDIDRLRDIAQNGYINWLHELDFALTTTPKTSYWSLPREIRAYYQDQLRQRSWTIAYEFMKHIPTDRWEYSICASELAQALANSGNHKEAREIAELIPLNIYKAPIFANLSVYEALDGMFSESLSYTMNLNSLTEVLANTGIYFFLAKRLGEFVEAVDAHYRVRSEEVHSDAVTILYKSQRIDEAVGYAIELANFQHSLSTTCRTELSKELLGMIELMNACSSIHWDSVMFPEKLCSFLLNSIELI
ncbi:hypothetical protein HC928_21250 [bacterium]|nr:hypothetical protein [bacterium]